MRLEYTFQFTPTHIDMRAARLADKNTSLPRQVDLPCYQLNSNSHTPCGNPYWQPYTVASALANTSGTGMSAS